MSNSFDVVPPQSDQDEELKKKKLWRNLFLLSLSVTLLLVGIFWLPIKAIQVNEFFNSPSVNLPKRGKLAQKNPADQSQETQSLSVNLQNVLPWRMVFINASSEKDWIYFSFSKGEVIGTYYGRFKGPSVRIMF